MPTHLPQLIQHCLLRELASLRRELAAYPDERQIWQLPAGLPNSTGTLILHLAGNLRHFVGAVLGGSGYNRDRDFEFAARDLPRERLLAEIQAAEEAIRGTLPRLSAEELAADFPEPLRGHTVATSDMLLQLATHLAYHLGQVSYHRRLVTGNAEGVGALSPAELSTARPAST